MKHYMHLKAEPFQKIYEGTKTIELRLYDEKRRLVNVGDEIVFTSLADESNMVVAKVLKLHLFDSFTELYDALPLEKCGYTKESAIFAKSSDMNGYYSLEKQAQYGVVGIEFEVSVKYFDIKHSDYIIKCKLFQPCDTVKGVVIGVHGFAGDKESSALEAVSNGLGDNYALLCFDFPAHGTSPASDDALLVDNCKRDLLAVFKYVQEHFPKLPICIFATSFGGYITLLSMSENSFAPEKVILRAPAIKMADVFKNKIVGEEFDLYRNNGTVECGFDRKMNVPFEFYEGLVSNDAFSVGLNVPTLIFCATEDELVDYSVLHSYAETKSNVKIVDVKGATHRFKGPGELECVAAETVKWITGG